MDVKVVKRASILLMFFAAFFSSCQTADVVEEEPIEPVIEVIEEPAEESTEAEVVVEVAEVEESEPFVPTEEEFEEAFMAVEEVIQQLNNLIRSQQYDLWLEYLTEDYVRTYSDPELLAEYSQAERLVNNNIVLETLEDYFTYVVVPSRANLRLDDLVFIAEDHVEAIMEVRDRRISVYRLRLIDNEWKIES